MIQRKSKALYNFELLCKHIYDIQKTTITAVLPAAKN